MQQAADHVVDVRMIDADGGEADCHGEAFGVRMRMCESGATRAVCSLPRLRGRAGEGANCEDPCK